MQYETQTTFEELDVRDCEFIEDGDTDETAENITNEE